MDEYDDDSSSNDSDYRDEEEDNKEIIEVESKGITELTTKRKRELDQIYNEMIEADKLEIKSKIKKASPNYQENFKKTNIQTDSMQQMLLSIFGKSKQHIKSSNSTNKRAKISSSADNKQRIQNAIKNLIKTTKITEKVKFAGQEITVQYSTSSSSSGPPSSSTATTTTQSSAAAAAVKTNLDNVLETLKGPKTLSTVVKSSIDWDQYKQTEGLEDQLAVAAKDGYVYILYLCACIYVCVSAMWSMCVMPVYACLYVGIAVSARCSRILA